MNKLAIAIFILGLIVGSTATNVLLGHQVDQLFHTNQELEKRLETAESELEVLKKNLASREKKVITSIEPHVSFTKNGFSKYEKETLKLEIGKIVEEMLMPVKGQELNELDYPIIPQVIDQRLIEVDDKVFRLHVKTVVITEKLLIYLEAELKPTNGT